jgi:hypothetical protein
MSLISQDFKVNTHHPTVLYSQPVEELAYLVYTHSGIRLKHFAKYGYEQLYLSGLLKNLDEELNKVLILIHTFINKSKKFKSYDW